MRSFTRACARFALAGGFAAGAFALSHAPVLAATAPGTIIQNTATASYQDSNGNTFNTNSNTVQTTVQNAPSLTVAPGTAQNVAPGQTVVDTFTLTNTGNASGNFNVPSDATVGAPGTLQGYVLNGAATGTCSVATPCTLAQLQTALAALTPTAPAGTITIGVEYTASQSATPGSTIATTLTGNITYPTTPTGCTSGTAGCAPAQTSSNVSATETDTVVAQARLDLQKSATAPVTAGTAIAWTINGNNGGGFAAHDLTSAQTLVGAAKAGIVVTDKLPTFGGSPLGLTAAPTVTLTGATAGAAATVYYSTSATAPTSSANWSTTFSANATWIAVYISGGAGGVELPSAPAGSSGAGAVTTAQFTISYSTNQPTGNGSGTPGSVTNIANGVIGGNPNATGTVPVVGPAIAPGTVDSTTTSLTGSENNTTPSTGTTPPGGASNVASSQGASAQTVLNGPVGSPAATGIYNGSAATTADNNNDFTAVSFPCANGAAINNGTFLCTVPAAGVSVPLTFQNTGNVSDNFTLTATAPAGYTVALYLATCPVGPYTQLPTCTQGAAISGTIALASGATQNYIAVYSAAAGVSPFGGVDSTITVKGTSAVASDANATHVDLYPGGPVKLTKTVTVTTPNCPSGVTPPSGGVCPGGVLTYAVAYASTAPANQAPGGTGIGTEPAFALAGITPKAGTLAVTEDGTASGNTWGANTFGLNAAPTDTTPGTTYAYSGGTAFAGGTYPSITAGYTKFVATVGGATGQVQPGGSGTISFTVTVK